MSKGRRLLVEAGALVLGFALTLTSSMTAMASSSKTYLDTLNAGATTIVDPSSHNSFEIVNATTKAVQNSEAARQKEKESTLVMANVRNQLNIRAEADEQAEKVGRLYRDCGGTILEKKNGWTKIQSGDLIGWAKDEYLLFNEDAEELANEVGSLTATNREEAIRVRMEPGKDAKVYGYLTANDTVDVVEVLDNGWVCIDYEGQNGYVLNKFVTVDFKIDNGETMEVIEARAKAEAEAKAKLVANYGAVSADADTKLLLAALIQCEAGGEPYEGQLAVGAVVMNRVRSGAYPDTIHSVIYASGQFTPALSGKVAKVYDSGKIKESCIQAAQEALDGATNVGEATHFRRNNGTREGTVIGHHVFW